VLELPGLLEGADGKDLLQDYWEIGEGCIYKWVFLVRYVGVNPQTGDAEWLDVNGNLT
jgi:hypothetical protein